MYNVPSENNPHVVYGVCPAEQFCSCVAGTRGRTCKHLILLSLLTCGGGDETFPDMDTQLQAHANNLIQKNKYTIYAKPPKTIEVESLLRRAVSKPCVVKNVCDCCTFSYHKKCASLLLAKGLFNEMSETSKDATDNSVEPIQNEIMDEDRHSTTIRKLESILKTLQTWERIPEDIVHKINELEVQTKEENVNFKRFGRLCDVDKSRKIHPLFANRKRKTNRGTASETRTDVTSSFPIKSRRKHKSIWFKKNNTNKVLKSTFYSNAFLPFYQTLYLFSITSMSSTVKVTRKQLTMKIKTLHFVFNAKIK